MQDANDSPVLRNVGANLREFRKQASLSQAALAQRSGVSRRTIINLEAGEANISLASLDYLADALGIRFVDLVSAPTVPHTRVNELAWKGENSESRAVLLGSSLASHEVQLWTWSLAEAARYDAEPDPAGWSEMLMVIEGELNIEFPDTSIHLLPGEHATYSSAQSYSYVNAGEGTVKFIRNVIS
ncbi:XRE family transcriptional regulator [Glutamicibacter sp.]|uniref:XRE family transcriptional regulator n=1 Tax=Glutamicibacter sp. TaxID=1931995 RepID=UPI0028BF159B|nr:XRE family transcriptional regulator [Glutamicibacter sp.]